MIILVKNGAGCQDCMTRFLYAWHLLDTIECLKKVVDMSRRMVKAWGLLFIDPIICYEDHHAETFFGTERVLGTKLVTTV